MADAAAAAAEPIVYVNGVRHVLPPGRADASLLSFLRELGHTSVKLGCGEGGCGACCVMLSTALDSGALTHRAVNACLVPLYAAEGAAVVTCEGIGTARAGLHPVQQRLAAAHGSQCGFCTPGFVMSMYALLRGRPPGAGPPGEEEVEEALAGNLCRCTGYRPILDAFRPFARADVRAYTEEAIAAARGGLGGVGGENGGGAAALANGGSQTDGNGANGSAVDAASGVALCPSTGAPCGASRCAAGAVAGGALTSTSVHKAGAAVGPLARPPGAATVEPIFPPELRRRAPAELHLPGAAATWRRPLTLARLLELKAAHPEAKLVVGATEVAIEMKFKKARYPVLIAPTLVPELNAVAVEAGGVRFGAAATLTRVLEASAAAAAGAPRARGAALRALAEQLRWFAGPPVRNAASLGGNVATASPISDLNPLLVAARATFLIAGAGTGERVVSASAFFLGYRRVDLRPHEVLVSVFLPFTREREYVREFKQARRRDDDTAIVNAGMRVRMALAGDVGADGSANAHAGEWVVAEAALAYGGVGPKTLQATRAAAALVGRPLGGAGLTAALVALREDVSLAPDAPGGMPEFRAALAASFLFKFVVHAALELEKDAAGGGGGAPYAAPFPPEERCAAAPYARGPSSGVQVHAAAAFGDVLGAPARHAAADLQATGEAVYVDDAPLPPRTLHAALVRSTRPHARLLSVDAAAARALPGVAGVFGAADVPGDNRVGPVLHDEELFASEVVTCVGAAIAVVVGDSEAAARAGAAAVRVDYEDLPAILDVDAAIAAKSFYEGFGNTLERGDVGAALAAAERTLSGEVRMGGQEHFYLEPNSHIVVPGEGGELVSYSSTQCPDKHQRYISSVLGLPAHKVVVRTKRLGGGFGGKETRAAAVNAAAALPAHLLQRPVRLVLDRDEDMATTGHRHPFFARFTVGFSAAGDLLALDAEFFSNAGCSLDLSGSIMDRALLHADCAYAFPALRARGWVCRTNLPSNTAFRGFGGPQGQLAAEAALDAVAAALGAAPETLRARNLYRAGADVAPCGQVVDTAVLRRCWDGVIAAGGGLPARRAAAAELNLSRRYLKRGLAAVPTKFGISFTTKFLNQAGALVHIYAADGTVLVTHGGVEMGQGLHTKVCQVVAAALGCALSDVHVAETATDKVRAFSLISCIGFVCFH
jgi:xanthine dehydrogenase/oxidase